MSGTLKDVGKHIGTYGDGHYEATVLDDGSVKVTTIFDDPKKSGEFTVYLSRVAWDRLAKWVEFQRADEAVQSDTRGAQEQNK